jgi:hypothetical protein
VDYELVLCSAFFWDFLHHQSSLTLASPYSWI